MPIVILKVRSEEPMQTIFIKRFCWLAQGVTVSIKLNNTDVGPTEVKCSDTFNKTSSLQVNILSENNTSLHANY